MSEAAIQRAVVAVWRQQPKCHVWRNNIGMATYGKGGKVRYGVGDTGGSDLIGISHGKFMAIECKARKGVLSGAQLEFLRDVEACGGIARIATQSRKGGLIELTVDSFLAGEHRR